VTLKVALVGLIFYGALLGWEEVLSVKHISAQRVIPEKEPSPFDPPTANPRPSCPVLSFCPQYTIQVETPPALMLYLRWVLILVALLVVKETIAFIDNMLFERFFSGKGRSGK